MLERTDAPVRRARMTIVGFSCNQAYLYAIFYLAGFQNDVVLPFARAGLFVLLMWMALCFAVLFVLLRRRLHAVFRPPMLAVCAALPVVGAALRLLLAPSLPGVVVEGACWGVPAAFMLCAWGSVMGGEPIERSVPEVFIAAALGAAVCFVFAAIPVEGASLLMSLLLIGSAACCVAARRLRDTAVPVRGGDGSADAGLADDTASPTPADSHVASDAAMSAEAIRLSGRIIAGTGVFGLAAGLMETLGASTADTASSATFLLLLFIVYCLAALQLFGGRPLAGMRAILPKRNDSAAARDDGPLDGAYRLAVLLMMAGFLLTPLLVTFGLPEESVVLAGYLGISVVLMSLFLVMGRLAGRDAARTFARGFAALVAGEAVGIVCGNVIVAVPAQEALSLTIAIAGIAVLCGYLFLFTERDLRALSVVVDDVDRFDEACASIAREAGLSKREAEVLPLALRGRTSERIAQELFISKNTVDTHMRRIYAKCDVHSRQELIDLGERVERQLRGGR